jgi:hypothetical protein
MRFWGLSRTSRAPTPKAVGAVCLLACALLAWRNESRAGDLPSPDIAISAKIAKDFNVPTLTLPFQKIKCRFGVDGDCNGPAESAAGIRLLTVIPGPGTLSRDVEPDQICVPSPERLTRTPESDTTKLGHKSYLLPAGQVREQLGRLLNIELPVASYANFHFVVVGAAQDQSDYPPPRFRREVADACPGHVQLLVTRLVRARFALAFDQAADIAQPLKDALKKAGFVPGGPALPNLFVSADVYLLGFFALPLSQTP